VLVNAMIEGSSDTPGPAGAGPVVKMRLGRRVIGPATALLIALGGSAAFTAETQAAPCTFIEHAVLQVRNVGAPAGDEQLSVGGELADGADFRAAFAAGRGVKLRLQDLGAGVADVVFDLTASGVPGPRRQNAECEPGMDARTSRRGRKVRIYRRPEGAGGEGCSSDPRDGSALLRVAEGTDGVGIRFRLRTASTELDPPTGPLRASIAIGTDSEERACATYTFGSDECERNGSTITCRSNQDVPPAAIDCRRTGCSGQVCGERDVVTTCEFLPHYACYRDATCEQQPDGSCGWTPTEDLQRCVAEASHPGPTPTPRPAPDDAWFACEHDSDCAVYPGLDCCGCSLGGGPEVAINESHRDDVDAYRECGDDVLCPGEYLCRDGLEAVCDHGVCAVR
jgi:eight-cysteine-cluster-containing protein